MLQEFTVKNLIDNKPMLKREQNIPNKMVIDGEIIIYKMIRIIISLFGTINRFTNILILQEFIYLFLVHFICLLLSAIQRLFKEVDQLFIFYIILDMFQVG